MRCFFPVAIGVYASIAQFLLAKQPIKWNDFWKSNLHLHANSKKNTLPLTYKDSDTKKWMLFQNFFDTLCLYHAHTQRILPDMASFAFVSIAVQRVISADAIVLTSVY